MFSKRIYTLVSLILLLASNALAWQRDSGGNDTAVARGTIVKLILKNGLNTSISRKGDRFSAEVAEDVTVGSRVAIPRGSIVSGAIQDLESAKHMSLLRGKASMALRFDYLRISGREVPIVASLVSVHDPHEDKQSESVKGEGRIQANTDVKGALTKGAVGVAGGSILGAVFGNVARGLALGSIGGAVAILAPKGGEVSLPEGAGLQIRLDRDLSVE